MRDYSTDPILAPYWFGDSYVRSFHVGRQAAEICADIALSEAHPDYEPPPPTKALCWRRGFLRFDAAERIEFDVDDTEPVSQPDGSISFGDIYGLKITDDGWFLEADIGTLTVHGGTLTVTLV